MTHRSASWRWLPRLLAIAYALFLSLFAFDSWEGVGFWEGLGHFLVHLAPVYVVLFALAVAWHWPRVGGVLFVVLAIGFTLVFGWREAVVLAALAAPPVVIGLLFLLDGYGGRARAKIA